MNLIQFITNSIVGRSSVYMRKPILPITIFVQFDNPRKKGKTTYIGVCV